MLRSAGVNDNISTDIHLTEPTERDDVHASNISSTKLMNDAQQHQVTVSGNI